MNILELFESKELGKIISAALKAKETLSAEALIAIDNWQNSAWDIGRLQKAYQENNDLAKEIDEKFEPVRKIIRSIYGNYITLYRGVRDYEPSEHDQKRVIYSWTSDIRVAKKFAGIPKYKPITDEDIERTVNQFNKYGFVKFRGHYYKRTLDDPEYFNIYDRNKNFITDGDDLEEILKSDQEGIDDILKNKGNVITRNVNVDDIVWITNDYNCKEFIVKN